MFNFFKQVAKPLSFATKNLGVAHPISIAPKVAPLAFTPNLSFTPSLTYSPKFSIAHSQAFSKRRERENQIADILKQQLNASFVKVDDSSVGGSACGQMYRMVVQSPLFNEKSKVEQHQMVTFALKDMFKDVHGYNLKTIISN